MHHQPHSGMAGPLAVSPHCEPSAEPSLQAHCTGVTHSGREFVGSGRRKGALGSYRDRPKALGSPVLLVPSPRETPAVHCASPFFLFQGPRGPDGPAGEQGSQGLKVWIPVTCPFYHLPCWVRHPGSRAHTLLCRRPLEESLRKAVGQFLRAHGATHSGLPSTCKPQAWGWGREKEL